MAEVSERKFRMVKTETGIHAEMQVSHYNGTSEVEIILDGKLVALLTHDGIELCTSIDPALGISTDEVGQMKTFVGRASRRIITSSDIKEAKNE